MTSVNKKGYTTEAAERVRTYNLNSLNRITALISPHNIAAWRLALIVQF
jgi:RimJ/RimL family protein N-acetyltransferase